MPGELNLAPLTVTGRQACNRTFLSAIWDSWRESAYGWLDVPGWVAGAAGVDQPAGVPLFMNVTLTVKPERRESFLTALRDVLPAVRAEPNCIYLHAGQSVTEPDVFVLSEGWGDLVEYRDVVL